MVNSNVSTRNLIGMKTTCCPAADRHFAGEASGEVATHPERVRLWRRRPAACVEADPALAGARLPGNPGLAEFRLKGFEIVVFQDFRFR